MTSYIANHEKKRRILRDREDDLRRALRRADAPEKITRAAKAVRDARIRVVRMKKSRLPPTDPNYLAAQHRYNEEIEQIAAQSLEAIAQEYKNEEHTQQ